MTSTATLTRYSRVAHRIYGRGIIREIFPAIPKPAQARVLFDSNSAPRRVWLADLAPEPVELPAGTPADRVIAPVVA